MGSGPDDLPDTIRRRARHVMTESTRVEQFVAASAAGDIESMGSSSWHRTADLQQDYEVSSAELDFLVDCALAIDGTLGARMTGGGFGGCTVNMLRPDAVAGFRERIAAEYERQFQVTPTFYECKPSNGAGERKI